MSVTGPSRLFWGNRGFEAHAPLGNCRVGLEVPARPTRAAAAKQASTRGTRTTRASLLIILLAVAICRPASANDPPVVHLRDKGAPAFERRKGEREVRDRQHAAGEYWLTYVHNPYVTVFLPPKEKATGAAVVTGPAAATASCGRNSRARNRSAGQACPGVVMEFKAKNEPPLVLGILLPVCAVGYSLSGWPTPASTSTPPPSASCCGRPALAADPARDAQASGRDRDDGGPARAKKGERAAGPDQRTGNRRDVRFGVHEPTPIGWCVIRLRGEPPSVTRLKAQGGTLTSAPDSQHFLSGQAFRSRNAPLTIAIE
jgi:hypothetical protein